MIRPWECSAMLEPLLGLERERPVADHHVMQG
jgi:hypothetical protein